MGHVLNTSQRWYQQRSFTEPVDYERRANADPLKSQGAQLGDRHAHPLPMTLNGLSPRQMWANQVRRRAERGNARSLGIRSGSQHFQQLGSSGHSQLGDQLGFLLVLLVLRHGHHVPTVDARPPCELSLRVDALTRAAAVIRHHRARQELQQPLARVFAGQGPFRARGRYWDRTSDLFRVREARYRCANRPFVWGVRGGDGI